MADDENRLKKLTDYKPEELENLMRGIRAKLLSNKNLTPEEKLLWTEYAEDVVRLEEQEKIAEVKAKNELEQAKQTELLEQFDSLPEEDKLDAETEGAYLKKSPSVVNEVKAKWKLDRVTTKAKKKGGAIIEKAYLDSSIEFIWVKTPKTFIEYLRVDENGEKVRSIARVTKTKHRLKGTSVPVHIAIEGVSENVNLLEGVNTSLSAQHINQMNQLWYQAGFFDALDAKEQSKKKFNIEHGLLILMLIVICVMIYVAYQQYQLFELIGKLAPQAVQVATGG